MNICMRKPVHKTVYNIHSCDMQQKKYPKWKERWDIECPM